MGRLAVLLLGLNAAAWVLMVGFAPRLGSCSYPTGSWYYAYVNCHDTSRTLPLALSAAIASLAYVYYRAKDPKGLA